MNAIHLDNAGRFNWFSFSVSYLSMQRAFMLILVLFVNFNDILKNIMGLEFLGHSTCYYAF